MWYKYYGTKFTLFPFCQIVSTRDLYIYVGLFAYAQAIVSQSVPFDTFVSLLGTDFQQFWFYYYVVVNNRFK